MIFYEDEALGKIITWKATEWSKKQTYVKFDDLISIGYLSLVKAQKTYKENEKTKFTTYLIICIENAIINAVTKEANQEKTMQKYKKTYSEGLENECEKADIEEQLNEILNEEEQKLIRLYYKEKRTLTEIAGYYNTNSVNIYRRMQKIKEKLRENI